MKSVQIKIPNGFAYLPEDDERVAKIRRGCSYSVEGGEIVVSGEEKYSDPEQILAKLDEGTASTQDLKEAAKFLLRKYLESGKI